MVGNGVKFEVGDPVHADWPGCQGKICTIIQVGPGECLPTSSLDHQARPTKKITYLGEKSVIVMVPNLGKFRFSLHLLEKIENKSV